MSLYEPINAWGLGPNSQKDFIEFNKLFSEITSVPKKNERKRCYLCKKNDDRLCSSHTIPQFVLKNIADNGILNNTQIFNPTKYINDKNGVKSTQTFKMICSDCDKKYFKDYEEEKALLKEPDEIILSQIALKSYLSRISKHNTEKRMAASMIEKAKGKPFESAVQYFYKQRIPVIEYNLCRNKKQLKTVINAIKSKEEIFRLKYFRVLDYVVPYAMQSHSVLPLDLNNKLLVDVFKKGEYEAKDDIHFCIFPLTDKSVILIFGKKECSLYDELFDELNKKDLDEQLSTINFFAFAYFEDIFLHKNIDPKAVENKNLQLLVTETISLITTKTAVKGVGEKEKEEERIKAMLQNLNIEKRFDIPNLLDKKYCVK